MMDCAKQISQKVQRGERTASASKYTFLKNKRKITKQKEPTNNPFTQFSPVKTNQKTPTKQITSNLRYFNQVINNPQVINSISDFSQFGFNKTANIPKRTKNSASTINAINNKNFVNILNSKPKECFYKRLLNVKQSVFIEQKANDISKNKSSNITKRKGSATPGTRNNSTPHCNKIIKKKMGFGDIAKTKIRSIKSPSIGQKFIKENISPLKNGGRIKQQITVSFIKPKKEIKCTYCILPNNNGKLIERCMQTRTRWDCVDKGQSSICNLYWTPLAYKINFLRNDTICQYVNHLEYHSELSNKMKLFINLLRHCEFTKINLFSFYPLTIIFQLSHPNFNEQFNNFKKLYNDISKFVSATNTPNPSIANNCYINYFNINLSKRIGTEQKIIIPRTHYAGRNLWLIKPINLNRGRCIKILNNIEDITTEITNIKENKVFCDENKNKISKAEYVLIQKYIERPLLYKNRKFDIRMWVLFTDLEDVYVFKEGHLKATCDRYDLNSLDPYIHLTNYSVQKHNQNFSKTEQGNEISFEEFQNELNVTTKPIKNFRKEIYPKICNIIRITSNATKSKLNSFINKNSFEIFGYDFLIDCEFNPYLIEINTNPGYEESSPLIKMLVPRMIDDALRLTIDTSFPREPSIDKYALTSQFEVKGYDNKENMWQKLNK